MSENTKSILVLGTLILIAVLGWKLLPSRNSVDKCVDTVNKEIAAVKLYVDKKVRMCVEECKTHSPTAEIQQLQIHMHDMQKRTAALEEKVVELETDNAQLRIYIANLERLAHNSAEADKNFLVALQAFNEDFEAYKNFQNEVNEKCGIALQALSNELDKHEALLNGIQIMLNTLDGKQVVLERHAIEFAEFISKEIYKLKQGRSVLTKQTIVKNHYYCVPRRCCR